VSISNLSALKRFVKGNTTGATGSSTVSVVFATVSTSSAATATATALYTGTSKKKFALPAHGYVEVQVGDTTFVVPYYKKA